MFIYKYTYISLNKISGFTLFHHIASSLACIVSDCSFFSSIKIGLYPITLRQDIMDRTHRSLYVHGIHGDFFPYMIYSKSVQRFGFCLFVSTCSKVAALPHTAAAKPSIPGVQSFPVAPGCVVT